MSNKLKFNPCQFWPLKDWLAEHKVNATIQMDKTSHYVIVAFRDDADEFTFLWDCPISKKSLS